MPTQVGRSSNLNLAEKRALRDLQSNKEFVIKEADKGGNVVLWSIEAYLEEANRQLTNPRCYQKLPSDPTAVFASKFDSLLCRTLSFGIISPQEKKYLWVEHPVTATFYMLPKIHKDEKKPPGRPIVSSIGSICERASEYLDFFFQPIVTALPSFIRDSAHFIEVCGRIELPGEFYLVTCDVESLYSNIKHSDGLHAVTFCLDKLSHSDRGHDSFLLDLLKFVLHHNYFLFDRTFYLQTAGVAMGAKCAPTYANIFLGWWEEVFVYPSLAYQHHVRNWHRYIDDLFFIWSGSREGCTDFIHSLNSNPHNIFLTHSISNSSTSFLDLRIFVQGNKLVTDLFRKPTATNALLEFNSFHPWHTKVGVPTGQFLRIRRNCTRDQDFLMQARDLTDRFRQRSYPKRVVATAFQRARQHDQASLLIPVGRSRESQTRFITDYNDSWGQGKHPRNYVRGFKNTYQPYAWRLRTKAKEG
ncbi:uncharacterized protein [Ranitomeya imitator]|uniref:uncharacterized protein n=2 Tax=Ranitomeya imitator TaxID=111125 RepID=UPI0037E7F889